MLWSLLISFLLVVGSGAITCPVTNIVCYPSDCCSQFQYCVDGALLPPLPTAAGTVCKGGYQVFPRDCNTPCASSPTASTTTTRATTKTPSSMNGATTRTPTSVNGATTSTAASVASTAASVASTAASVASTAASVASTVASTAAASVASTTVASAASTTAASVASTAASSVSPTTFASSNVATSSNSGGSTTGTVANCSLAEIFSQSDFNQLFPYANGAASRTDLVNQHAIFTYSNIIAAAEYYPDFGCTGDIATRKRELAAFLGQTSQETSGWWGGQPYIWGYYFSTELGPSGTGCTNATCTGYCDPTNVDYPCAPGQAYYGRGALQLSWNYNYGQVSLALYGNNLLLLYPDLLFVDGIVAFRTSLWFWMTSQSPKPSCHEIITGLWVPSPADVAAGRLLGYGMVTNVINGALECNVTTPQAVENRVQYYTTYANWFGTTTGSNLYCDQMQHY